MISGDEIFNLGHSTFPYIGAAFFGSKVYLLKSNGNLYLCDVSEGAKAAEQGKDIYGFGVAADGKLQSQDCILSRPE